MIGGLAVHDGNEALARHWLKPGDNEGVWISTCGLLTDGGAFEALEELRRMAWGCRTSKPLMHVWASPSVSYSADEWEAYWQRFEREFGMAGYPFVEARHQKLSKGGRSAPHLHRAYLRITPDGKAIPISHAAARMEKLSRISEFMVGESFVSGRYNQSVIQQLEKEGLAVVAGEMKRWELDRQRAVAAPTPKERATSERLTDLALDEVWSRAWRAWSIAKNGTELTRLLRDCDLRIARGDKAIVVVTPACNIVPLLRALNRAGARNGQKLRKADLDKMLESVVLPNAEILAPIEGHDAGQFAHVGNHRREIDVHVGVEPASQAYSDRTLNVHDDILEAQPAVFFDTLSPEQQQALIQYRDHFFDVPVIQGVRTAAPAAKPDQIPKVAPNKASAKAEAELALHPQITTPSYKDPYKAALTGLPGEPSLHINFVRVLEEQRRYVFTPSGTRILLEPDRALAFEATMDTVPVMVGHARESGWAQVQVEYGTSEWREEITRKATLAGLAVVNPELQHIVTRALFDDWVDALAEAARLRSSESVHRFREVNGRLRLRPDRAGVLTERETARFDGKNRQLDDLDQRYGKRASVIDNQFNDTPPIVDINPDTGPARAGAPETPHGGGRRPSR